MSIKKKHLYDMAWNKLLELCRQECRPVTAGEFAALMGIARSTAQRWLTEMMVEGAIFSFKGIGKNRQSKTTYEPVGRDKTWFYAYPRTETIQAYLGTDGKNVAR